ncbi:MAG: lipase family protein [Gemmataceae bacterium]
MTQELIEDALGDPRNANYLALASDLAYMNADQGVAAFKEQLGLEASLISVGNTQAWVGHNDDHIVVAFRGTEAPTSIEGMKDWLLNDAMNLLVLPEGRLGTDFAAAGVGARFHLGFLNALADIWEPVFTAVEAEMKKKERPLWITGHSLGGAIAMLSAWLFKRKFVNVHQVYTFGAPMIGNAAASEAFDKALPDRVFRYVNATDPVPLLPTMSLIANDYGHCLKEIALGTALEKADNAIDMVKALAARAADGLTNPTIISEMWAGIQARVAAHGLDSYRKLIAEMFDKKA